MSWAKQHWRTCGWRLSAEERSTLAELTKLGRNQGVGRLRMLINDPKAKHDPTWKACAICDGSFDVFKIKSKQQR